MEGEREGGEGGREGGEGGREGGNEWREKGREGKEKKAKILSTTSIYLYTCTIQYIHTCIYIHNDVQYH